MPCRPCCANASSVRSQRRLIPMSPTIRTSRCDRRTPPTDRRNVVSREGGFAMQAQDVMTPNPATVSPQTSVADVWDLMRQHAIRHMPVVERGVLVGIVSDRDLADGLRRELSTPVVKVMSSDVVDVDPDAELGEVVDLLVENRIGAVPVVRPETQELVGIVSYIDVLAAVRDLLEVSE